MWELACLLPQDEVNDLRTCVFGQMKKGCYLIASE